MAYVKLDYVVNIYGSHASHVSFSILGIISPTGEETQREAAAAHNKGEVQVVPSSG